VSAIFITESAAGMPSAPTDVVTQGYIQILSNGVRLAGSVVFGDPDKSTFSAALPMVSRLEDSIVFSQVASNETYFMGIAIINPNGTAVNVTLELYTDKGDLIASTGFPLAGGQRVAKLLTQYLPELEGENLSSGYARILSDQGIAGFALFGTQDLSVLSAIPPQVVP
jgi:hypothetical protein